MSVQVEELYKFHKEEEGFWNKLFPVKDLLPEIGFENIIGHNPDYISATMGDEQLCLTRKDGRWTYVMGVDDTGANNKGNLRETESGDLIDLAKRIYMPMYIFEGYQYEKNSPRPVIENLHWYNEAMRIEARNNLRSLIINQEKDPVGYKRVEPFISSLEREKFYSPRFDIFKEVKEHESNLVEGLTLRFGAKPYAPTIEEALIQLADIRELLDQDIKLLSTKYNLSNSVQEEMLAVAEKHSVPLMWQKDFNGRDEIEQSVYDAHKTKRDDLNF